ncbi:hypothetical protein MHPYR_230015 [uncultured Mycobacterium sp.]|uniref:Uncharacterized protein n=1 Tax=uncultured Mycobacterium sp. TaxID=171292 RepID=A0A1Y5P9R5_9MYCO|nr:hypothetical protein MHPYR_230015 [uncultured Mycobacterium sp.]
MNATLSRALGTPGVGGSFGSVETKWSLPDVAGPAAPTVGASLIGEALPTLTWYRVVPRGCGVRYPSVPGPDKGVAAIGKESDDHDGS